MKVFRLRPEHEAAFEKAAVEDFETRAAANLRYFLPSATAGQDDSRMYGAPVCPAGCNPHLARVGRRRATLRPVPPSIDHAPWLSAKKAISATFVVATWRR